VLTGRALGPLEPKSGRPELARLVRRIQALTFELRELRRRAEPVGFANSGGLVFVDESAE
jgi:hypothetical protein